MFNLKVTIFNHRLQTLLFQIFGSNLRFRILIWVHLIFFARFGIFKKCINIFNQSQKYKHNTVRKNTRYSKRKLEWKNVAKLSNIMLKGYQITKKIKSFPTEFFKNQPEVPKSRMAVKGLNWIRLKNRHHFEKPTF